MTGLFTQYVGETRDYRQTISGDVIVSVVWTCDPGGSVTTLIPGIGGVSTTGRFTTNKTGRLTLRVAITCQSGQVVIGEAKITVLS